MNGPVSTTSPRVELNDFSGPSGLPPCSPAVWKVDGTVALSTSSRVSGSMVVCTLSAFCCPGVGTRNPVLTPSRTETASSSA